MQRGERLTHSNLCVVAGCQWARSNRPCYQARGDLRVCAVVMCVSKTAIFVASQVWIGSFGKSCATNPWQNRPWSCHVFGRNLRNERSSAVRHQSFWILRSHQMQRSILILRTHIDWKDGPNRTFAKSATSGSNEPIFANGAMQMDDCFPTAVKKCRYTCRFGSPGGTGTFGSAYSLAKVAPLLHPSTSVGRG